MLGQQFSVEELRHIADLLKESADKLEDAATMMEAAGMKTVAAPLSHLRNTLAGKVFEYAIKGHHAISVEIKQFQLGAPSLAERAVAKAQRDKLTRIAKKSK